MMKTIVIIGSSPAGIKAAEEIRSANQEAEITVFCEGNILPYNRELLSDFLAKETTEERLLYRPKEFYKDKNINVVLGKKIQRVDFKKNRLITEEKEQIPFDILIITDVPLIRLSDIKGAQKMGVFNLRRLTDAKDFLSVLHLVDSIGVQANSLLALKTIIGLRKRKKEVVWIVPSSYILSRLIDKEPADMIVKHLEENGVNIIRENVIAEVLGEGDVKAIRLKTGKVIAAQAVIVGDALPDLKLFAESALTIEQGVVVNGVFKSNLDNVFALDHIFQKSGEKLLAQDDASLMALEEQGTMAAKAIGGEVATYTEPLNLISVQIFNLSCVLIGKTKYEEGLKEYIKTDVSTNLYRKIFVRENNIVGAVLINSANEQDQIVRYIKEKKDIQLMDNVFLGEVASDDVVQTAVSSTNADTNVG